MPRKTKRKRIYTQYNKQTNKYVQWFQMPWLILLQTMQDASDYMSMQMKLHQEMETVFIMLFYKSEIVAEHHPSHLNLNPLPTHLELRAAICEYVQQNQNSIPYIQQYHTFYINELYEEYNMTWDNFLIEQTHSGVYATELFIKTTAVLVGINICITSEYCTQQHPYNIVTSTWSDEETHHVNSLLLGNISGLHFQSLIPCELDIAADMENLSVYTPNRHQMKLRTRTKFTNKQSTPHNFTCDNDQPMSNSEQSIYKFIARRTTKPNVVPYYVGPMNKPCQYCNALRFTNESLNCCHNGKVNLPQLSSYPVEFRNLLTSNTSHGNNFREYIRQYNSSFAFASLGANIDKITTKGPYCFRIHGQLYH